MKIIQSAVAQYLQQKTGIRAVEERSKAVSYPVLTVAARETGMTLLCGGLQCEHSYAVTVCAVSDREREGKAVLLGRAAAAIMGGIPLTDDGVSRVLHPLDMKTEGDQLTFTVTLCRLVPQSSGESGAAENMQKLNINL